MIRVSQATPEEYVRQQRLSQSAEAASVFAIAYHFDQYYLPEQPHIELLALVSVTTDTQGLEVWAGSVGLLSDLSAPQCEQLEQLSDVTGFQALAAELEWPWLALDRALALEPISIKKPWGQEVWLTGIEARGQSGVCAGGFQAPLPWVLSIAPERLTGGLARQINLLKILDPLPEEVFGDLYFELHEEKQEVYVVTHVDEVAWPSGVGGIRFGFDDTARQGYTSDSEFKQAFADAVSEYEQVRREIDQLVDVMRSEQGVALNDAVTASQAKVWLEQVPVKLQDKEQNLRSAMDAFKGFKPLALGDVVKVPCFTPHSLLHGVRTIEFQTPVYERQILSFAQKVLTQDHWDTSKALNCVQLNTPADTPLKCLEQRGGVVVDEVVSFEGFKVWRIQLEKSRSWSLPDQFPYALLVGLRGTASIDELQLTPEQGAVLPGALAGHHVTSNAGETALLLALPR